MKNTKFKLDVIYTFTNVDEVKDFKIINGNRTINKAHVNKIRRAMADVKQCKYIAPIRVGVNAMVVMDGQHRLTAFRKAVEDGADAHLRVIFEDEPTDPKELLEVICRINSTGKNWGLSDYETRLREVNDSVIESIDKFIAEHPFVVKGKKKRNHPRYYYALLAGKNLTKDIKNNTLDMEDIDLELGHQVYEETNRMLEALGYESNGVNWLESFVSAWYHIRKNLYAYNDILEEITFDAFLDVLPDLFAGYQYATKKDEWVIRFTAAITEAKRLQKLR